MADEGHPLLENVDDPGHQTSDRNYRLLAKRFVLLVANVHFNIAFYCLMSSLYLYLKVKHYQSGIAVLIIYIMIGIGHALAASLAFLRGRFLANNIGLTCGFGFYVLSYAVLIVSSKHTWTSFRIVHCCAVAASFVLGFALIQQCLPRLTAELYQSQQSLQSSGADQFFISSGLSVLMVVAVSTGIQQNISFFVGYLVPCAISGLGLLVVLLGIPLYFKRSENQEHANVDDSLGIVVKVLRNAMYNYLRSKQLIRGEVVISDQSDIEIAQKFLDNAKIGFNGAYPDYVVDEVKDILSASLLFVFLIPLKAAFLQLYTGFLVQSLSLDLSVPGLRNLTVPVSWLCILCQLIGIFFFWLHRARQNVEPRRFEMVAALSIGSASTTLAGLLELFRNIRAKQAIVPCTQIIAGVQFQCTDIHTFWQVPQVLLLGIGDAWITQLALILFYRRCPANYKHVGLDLLNLATYAGALLGLILSLPSVVMKEAGIALMCTFYALSIVQLLSAMILWRCESVVITTDTVNDSPSS